MGTLTRNCSQFDSGRSIARNGEKHVLALLQLLGAEKAVTLNLVRRYGSILHIVRSLRLAL
jgi:hypothetical protein